MNLKHCIISYVLGYLQNAAQEVVAKRDLQVRIYRQFLQSLILNYISQSKIQCAYSAEQPPKRLFEGVLPQFIQKISILTFSLDSRFCSSFTLVHSLEG